MIDAMTINLSNGYVAGTTIQAAFGERKDFLMYVQRLNLEVDATQDKLTLKVVFLDPSILTDEEAGKIHTWAIELEQFGAAVSFELPEGLVEGAVR
jgi:hypothetical protein